MAETENIAVTTFQRNRQKFPLRTQYISTRPHGVTLQMKWSWSCRDSGGNSRASHRVQFRSGLVALGEVLPSPSVSIIPPLLHTHSCIYHGGSVASVADRITEYNIALVTVRTLIAGRRTLRQSLAFHQRI